MKTEMEFFDVLAVADCAAQVLARNRGSSVGGNGDAHESEFSCLRTYMRSNPVRALRHIWKNGEKSDRATLAARVLIWCDKKDRIDRVRDRIMALT